MARIERALPVLPLLLALLAFGTGMAFPLATALGHAGVAHTSPSDGERLAVSPSSLSIGFTEAVGIGSDGVRLVDATGASIPLVPATSEGSTVTQALPPLADGWYLATWTAISQDGHIVHGALSFAVGDAQGPPPTAPQAEPTTPAITAARAVADWGLVVAVGGIGAVLLLGATSRRVRWLVLGASAASAAGSLALGIFALMDAGQGVLAGPGLTAILGVLARATVLAGVALAVAATRWRTAAVLAAAALLITAGGGHPGTHPLTALLFLLHLCGAALWLGAAPAVLLALSDRSIPDAEAEMIVRRFSRLATVTLVLTVGGGSLLAVLLTDAFATGVDARYVVLLSLKVALVGTAAVLGALTRRRLAGAGVGRGRLRRLFALDAGLLVGVIVLSAGLAAGAPTHADAGGDDLHVGHCSIETPAGLASLTLVPAHVGTNTVFLDGAGELDHARVELRRGEDPAAIVIELAPGGAGWSMAGAAVPVEGAWDATVVLGRSAFNEETAVCRMRVLP